MAGEHRPGGARDEAVIALGIDNCLPRLNHICPNPSKRRNRWGLPGTSPAGRYDPGAPRGRRATEAVFQTRASCRARTTTLSKPRRHDHRRPRRQICRRISRHSLTVAPDRRARAIPRRTSTSQPTQTRQPLTPLPTSTSHVSKQAGSGNGKPIKSRAIDPSKSVILLTFLPPSQPSSGLLSPFSSRIPGLLSTFCCAVNRSFVANFEQFPLGRANALTTSILYLIVKTPTSAEG